MNKRFFSLLIVFSITLVITLSSLSAQNQTNTMLLEAIANGNLQQVQTSISGGTNINAPLNQLGWTALHAAVEFRQRDILNWLLQNQADVNVKDGQTPLYLAVQTGQSDTVNTLIDNHADVNITTNNGENALSLSQKIGLTSISSTLSQNGALSPNTENAGFPGSRRGMPQFGICLAEEEVHEEMRQIKFLQLQSSLIISIHL